MTRRIDAHHHVWDLAARDQPWITGDVMAPIRRSFDVDEFAVVAGDSGFAASVVVQTVTDITETEELLDLAEANPFVAGVVGYVDIAAADVGEQLDRLLARSSGSWLVGIRSLVQDEPDPAWLSRRAVVAGLREVGRRGLANDLLVLPHQLAAVVGAVSEVTESRFVIDHLAKPAIESAAWEPWATDLAAVARRDNVSAKLSGLVTEAEWATWTVDDVRPYTDHALSVFGPERLMFGSDWPVCTLAASYQRVVDLAQHVIGGLSEGDQAAVLGANATEVYALDSSARRGAA